MLAALPRSGPNAWATFARPPGTSTLRLKLRGGGHGPLGSGQLWAAPVPAGKLCGRSPWSMSHQEGLLRRDRHKQAGASALRRPSRGGWAGPQTPCAPCLCQALWGTRVGLGLWRQRCHLQRCDPGKAPASTSLSLSACAPGSSHTVQEYKSRMCAQRRERACLLSFSLLLQILRTKNNSFVLVYSSMNFYTT